MTDLATMNRETCRVALAEALKEHMTTPAAIHDHIPASFDGITPLVCVTGAPTDRQQDTATSYEDSFGLSVHLIVAYSLPDEDSYTPQDAERLLDRLEYEFAVAFLLINRSPQSYPWRTLSRDGRSLMDGPFQLSGVMYLREIVPIIAEVDENE